MKTCPGCKNEKPLTNEFWSRSSNRANGFHWCCKKCHSEKSKTQQARQQQKKRDARRYAKEPKKSLARDAARKEHGDPSIWECSVHYCNKMAEEWHHVNYDKPLFVIPLCRECHRDNHML